MNRGLALRRLPALGLTLVLELLGGLVIAQLHKVFYHAYVDAGDADDGFLLRSSACSVHFQMLVHKVIRVYTLIVSFMPAISALSGNLGLQVSFLTIMTMMMMTIMTMMTMMMSKNGVTHQWTSVPW